MKRILWLAGVLLLIILLLGAAGCDGLTPESSGATGLGGTGSNQNTGIWVTGEGKVTVVPDIAILSLGVEVQSSTVAQAQNEADNTMDAVFEELDDAGIDEDDIQTSRYSIYPVRRWVSEREEEVLIGYRVTNMVTVKVRNIQAVGTIIDSVAGAGGDYIRIDSISFTVDDPSAYYDEAREKAAADAKAKAEKLADTAGVNLGVPTYISESIGYVPSPIYGMAFAEAAPAAPTPISPGETEITLNVQIAYSIR